MVGIMICRVKVDKTSPRIFLTIPPKILLAIVVIQFKTVFDTLTSNFLKGVDRLIKPVLMPPLPLLVTVKSPITSTSLSVSTLPEIFCEPRLMYQDTRVNNSVIKISNVKIIPLPHDAAYSPPS